MRYFSVITLFFLSSVAAFSSNVIDEVVWVVGDEAILKSDVEEQKARMQYEGTPIEGDPYCTIPEEIAIQKLFLNQAKVDSITVSPNTVSMQVEQRINYFISQIGSKEKLEEYFGKSLAAMREELTTLIEEQMLVQQVQQKLVGDVKITPSEVQKFYDKLPKETVPVMPTKVEVQILAIAPKVPVQEAEAVKAKLRGFKERVERGEIDFSTLAILYSEDTESAKRGGELGFMKRGMLIPEFADVAFSLTDRKKVSHVVETEYGYHIIQLIEKRGDQLNCRHILLKPTISLEARQYALNQLDSIVDGIKTGTRTFEEAVTAFSTDKKTKMNGGVMMNPQTGDTRFQYQELPAEVARQVNRLEVGEVSEPFVMTDETGKQICAIVKLKNRFPMHQANITDDYQEIREMLKEEICQKIISDWIVERQKDLYVKIKDGWQNCEFKYPGWGK
ncbi:MAG: peptidylprolyl isomerase [Bacteroidales bacterium]|jgi:peptidyl-prolyl cis-trans isomerase SurA|nr:peptidylprolyl isomerase [Bacteroidales bacterium]MDD6356911.1 peptidylprolyl isomerase [Bacteroidales bacterium]